jgi:hypothetical protein
MTNLFNEAIAKVARLAEAVQEKIGEEVLAHVEKLHRLRAKLDNGIHSLDRGEGREFNVNEVIKRGRAQLKLLSLTQSGRLL